jgi:hypothetical protein
VPADQARRGRLRGRRHILAREGRQQVEHRAAFYINVDGVQTGGMWTNGKLSASAAIQIAHIS